MLIPLFLHCVNRFDRGGISSHMGDETWISRLLDNQADKAKTIEKRRR